MTVQERTLSVPVLDVAPFLAGEPGALEATASQLSEALRHVGFFFVVGHGVPWQLVRATFAEAARFHALPAATKEAIPFGGDRGGYLTLGGGTSYASRIAGEVRKPNLNAALFVRGGPRAAGNQFPPEADLPGFRAAVDRYIAAVHDLATSLLPLYAVALGLPPDHFAPSFVDADTTLRMSHYPVVPHEDHQWGLAAHTDANFMTLLPDNEVPGLEIHPGGSDWIQPPALPESFLVNSGDILRRWTNDHFLSTGHRVLNASGRDRYAIPYFLGPRPDAPIECLPTCTGPGDPPRYRPTTYGEYSAWFTSRNYARSTGQTVDDDDMP